MTAMIQVSNVLISLQAQIVAGDALGKFHYKMARRCGVLTFFDHFQVIILAVVCGVVTSKKSPRPQRCIKVDPATLERRHHQIPADQGERGGVAAWRGFMADFTLDADRRWRGTSRT